MVTITHKQRGNKVYLYAYRNNKMIKYLGEESKFSPEKLNQIKKRLEAEFNENK